MTSPLRTFLVSPLNWIQQFAMRRVFLSFAAKYDLVYFGYVNQHSDEHELVRGITVSAKHTDHHYCVGSFSMHDLTLVQRTDTMVFPGKPDVHYTWTILQVDLKVTNLPHIFIDANHHEETFYANMFLKFNNFHNVNAHFSGAQYDPSFAKSFKVYVTPDDVDTTLSLFHPQVATTLAQQFRAFDFEVFEDRLLIYCSSPAITLHTLENMLRVGSWLADSLDQYRSLAQPTSDQS